MNDHFLELNVEKIDTPLYITKLNGRDYLSKPFDFHLTVLTDNEQLSADDFLRKRATITLGGNDQTPQYYNGIIYSAIKNIITPKKADKSHEFSLAIYPWLSFLDDDIKNHIYCANHPMTIPEIVASIFKNHGYTDYDMTEIANDHAPLNYCVQHQETTLNFIHKLLIQAGISYYFKHTQDKHMLMFNDTGYFQNNQAKEVIIEENEQHHDHITKWCHMNSLAPSKISLGNFDFNHPSSSDVNSQIITTTSKNNAFEQYYETTQPIDTATSYLSEDAKSRAATAELEANQINASSNYRPLYAGTLLKLTNHQRDSENSQYIICAIQHNAYNHAHLPTQDNDQKDNFFYENNFQAYSAGQSFSSQASDHKTLSYGSQLAVVACPPNQEIHTDEWGRIKVHFISETEENKNNSYWLRTKQWWASNRFGAQVIPRANQELFVDFEEGNIERPIIIGTLSNANNKLPFNPEESPTISGFKTHTVGSKETNFANILSFEDESGKEAINIQAQKDLKKKVGNDETFIIHGKTEITIEAGDQFLEAKQDITLQAKNEIQISCGTSHLTLMPSSIAIQSDAIHYSQSSEEILPENSNNPLLAALDEARDG